MEHQQEEEVIMVEEVVEDTLGVEEVIYIIDTIIITIIIYI